MKKLTIDEELWMPYMGYMVSNLGRVKGPSERVLKLLDNGNGYLYFNCYPRVNGNARKVYVHRAVATLFISVVDPEANEVDHINGDRSDNRARNLAWCTHSQNHRNPLAVRGKRERMSTPESKQKYRDLMHARWRTQRKDMVSCLRRKYPESLRRDVRQLREEFGLPFGLVGLILGISGKLASNLYHRDRRGSGRA